MFAASKDERCNVSLAKNIQTAANQRKTFAYEILNRRDEIEFAVEPGFYGVLVGGSDVGKMAGLERANVRIKDSVSYTHLTLPTILRV